VNFSFPARLEREESRLTADHQLKQSIEGRKAILLKIQGSSMGFFTLTGGWNSKFLFTLKEGDQINV